MKEIAVGGFVVALVFGGAPGFITAIAALVAVVAVVAWWP